MHVMICDSNYSIRSMQILVLQQTLLQQRVALQRRRGVMRMERASIMLLFQVRHSVILIVVLLESVTAVRLSPVCTRRSVTFAPGTMASLVSETVPSTSVDVVCDSRGATQRQMPVAIRERDFLINQASLRRNCKSARQQVYTSTRGAEGAAPQFYECSEPVDSPMR